VLNEKIIWAYLIISGKEVRIRVNNRNGHLGT
jgi:hypothetical protein